MNSIKVIITSYPDQPGLVAEIWCEIGMLGTVRYQAQTHSFAIEFYSIQGHERPAFDLASWDLEIAKAKRRILEIEGVTSPKILQDSEQILKGLPPLLRNSNSQ